MVVTNGSRLVLVVWIFLALILMQSYTANLSSILTVNQLQPTIPSIKELRKSYVGYQNHSFVKGFLINQLGFQESMLKPYCSVDDYQEALSKGSENEGVSAIFDEIPYIKLFLAQYTTGYLMVGPTYRTDGLGFALPIGSPMVANFSRAILNFTQRKYMNSLEKKYFGMVSIDQDETGAVSSASPSLTSRSFAGLFIIISIIVLLALLSSKIHILRRLIQRYIFSNSGDIAHPPQINNVEENHNSNQNNRDESIEEGILEGRSS
ncbi:glutamate receptor 2.9-like [Gossypium raimondii]|uniref:glutamate receptor 2.9-like n=1 Tax=Gossypium raimondii TaxID=29730 RepID=UPI00227AB63B|nr:glutamate receptor 2.9-like [Gossypium raimondii]